MSTKNIVLTLLTSIFFTSVISQNIKMRLITEEAPLNFNNGTHKLSLYCMSGFDDSVCIYLNKKLVQRLYVKSLASCRDAYVPITLNVNFKKDSNLIVIKRKKSRNRYYSYVIKGYGNAIFYLENDPTVVYTNRPPAHQ